MSKFKKGQKVYFHIGYFHNERGTILFSVFGIYVIRDSENHIRFARKYIWDLAEATESKYKLIERDKNTNIDFVQDALDWNRNEIYLNEQYLKHD